MCRYFCNTFIDFMLNNKRLANFTNLFFPNNFMKIDESLNIFNNLIIIKQDVN